ncbi:hypothetical protein CJP72_21850 [Citrobacter sp. NCU1]|uniref:hypothetical protein n=1 Tax=Citrobacter sp. NCU1 TaxID=2026683 RepID=UPI001391EDC7|nr:hypothetical protein [Citrobacter sp. NCU1]NDO83303.1 hypothetical protein [Citrobacter sp. NCU1]
MSVEFKIFGSACFVKDKALKKDPSLKTLARAVKAPNKGVAETIIAGKMAEHYPANIDDYFKAKVWEHGDDLPLPPLDEFSTDFFETLAVWDVNSGKPKPSETESAGDEGLQDNDSSAVNMKTVKLLGLQSRAACLAMFGPIQDITENQYGQIIDLINDEDGGFTRELAEAISREPRVLELLMARQEELLAYVREKAKESAQWTDIKKLIVKWLDTPPATRETVNTDGGADDQKQRSIQLRYLVASGVIARSMDFDISSRPIGIEMRINDILSDKNDTEVTDWFVPFSRTPGVYDFGPAAIVAMIKTAPEKLHVYPAELRKYIDKCVSSFDCINPPQLVIDIACGRSILPLPQRNDEAGEAGSGAWSGLSEAEIADDIDRTLTARAATERQEAETEGNAQTQEIDGDEKSASNALPPGESTLGDGSEANAGVMDNRQPITDREIEIAFALNDLLSGRTSQINLRQAEHSVACAGHPVSYLIPIIMADIETTEFCLSPNLSDDEINLAGAVILDVWSDDENIRQKESLDAIVEYRQPAPPKPVVIDPPVITARPKKETEPMPGTEMSSLTWRQQIIIAAMQGMCSNPAYSGTHDDIPFMAVALADGVITAESN